MKRPAKIILFISIVLTALAFIHDYKYDTPSVPYTTGMHIGEILIAGPIYIGIFFSIIYGVYALVKSLVR